MNGNARPRIDYTSKDFESLRAELLELGRERLPAWTDQSANDFGVLLTELFAHMGDLILYYQDRIANESYLETAAEPRSVVELLRLIGYELRPPQPATAALTLLFDPAAAAPISVAKGTRFTSTTKVENKNVEFQYVRPTLTLDPAALPQVTVDGVAYKAFEPLPVEQIDTDVPNEVLGSSAGTGGQRFRVRATPLVEASLTVAVDAGAGPKAWTRRDTLLDSGPADEHYVVRRDAEDQASVEFGDGKYGKVPPAGRNNVTASYRTGGGTKGNVAARTITKAVGAIASLKRVLNAMPATGGSDREPLAEAKLRAPRQFRSLDRAVTAEDYEQHARRFGLGKARARAESWNVIELYVAPAGGGHPTDTLKEELRRYFERRRMVTSIVEIRDPRYIPVYVDGTLEVEPYFFADQVQQRAHEAVRALFEFEHAAFGDTKYLSEIYEAVTRVEGVKSVTVTNFSRSATPSLPVDGRLRFVWNEIPTAAHASGIRFTEILGGRGAE